MEILDTVIFYVTSILLITSGILTVLSKKIMNSVFFAFISFLMFAVIYLSLNAAFNAVVQISIYGAAMSILFAVAVSITDYKSEQNQKYKFIPRMFLAAIGTIFIITSILFSISHTIKYDVSLNTLIYSTGFADNVKQLSVEMLSNNYYAFELIGIYLLTALIGVAVMMVFKGKEE